MRPKRLVMEGFGAFRQSVTVDFDDTDFFALVGPTGSGKSTVLDAMCFALYGSVPRYADLRLVSSAMSAGHVETKVALTFEVAGAAYTAVRVLRRQRDGKVTTKEARLEAADGTVLAGQATKMAAAVEELVGLPFEHFTRCVILPQGEFARFLHDRPADRQELLVQLLDLHVYGAVASAARRRADAADATATFAERRLADLADATPEVLAAARQRVLAVGELVEELAEAEPTLTHLAAAVADARRAAADARTDAAALAAVRVPAEVGALARAVADAGAVVDEAEIALAAATTRADAAAQHRAALPDTSALMLARDAHDRLAAATIEVDAAGKRVAAADKAARAADEVAATVAAEVEAASAAMDAARTASAAYAVHQTLRSGEPCPACGQDVHAVATMPVPEAWLKTKRVHEEAVAAAKKADANQRRAGEQHAAARAVAETAARQVRTLAEAVAAHPDREALDAAIAAGERAAAVDAAARADVETATKAAARARAEVDAARASGARAATAYHRQRDPLVALGAPPPDDDLATGWEALAAWAAAEQPRRQAVATQADAAADRAEAELSTGLAALAEQCAAAEVAPSGAPTLAALRVAAVRAEEQARHRVDGLEDAIAEADRVRADAVTHRAGASVARELARLLAANRFEAWLVAEALAVLTAGASTTLHDLSGGQYSLEVDASSEFFVVDHANGDERRPVRTLSGGETFQASLALALALADHLSGLAAQGGTKLEAIFLDEGFGTLDAESLEVVAATVEALGGTGRMVGVVTHVAALAERVPVRYEVRKGPATATVTRVVGLIRVVVDPWDPSYGTSNDDGLSESGADVHVGVEEKAAEDAWAPVPAPDRLAGAAREVVVVVDGVRRIDARVWVGGDGGPGDRGDGGPDDAEPGVCASWAAGAVRCDGRAVLVAVEVGRALVSASPAVTDLVTPHGTYRARMAATASPESLSLGVQQRMNDSEIAVAASARPDGVGLLVVDGPLRGRQTLTDAVGLVKTHHTAYLPGGPRAVIGQLRPGERTPVFTIASSWVRHAWYLRLPGAPAGAPMAGVVRCECSADLAPAAAVALADRTAAALPRFASEPHKDSRAPQNLYPIGGLDRELRRRLGDPRLLYRGLRLAAR